MIIVLDTNVLVSGLLSALGPPARILELAVKGQVSLAMDERIWDEYAAVCARPEFGFPQNLVAELLKSLGKEALWVKAEPLADKLPDPEDLKFLEVAVAAGADAVVTGNKRHFPALRHSTPVLSPAEFMRKLESGPD